MKSVTVVGHIERSGRQQSYRVEFQDTRGRTGTEFLKAIASHIESEECREDYETGHRDVFQLQSVSSVRRRVVEL